MIWFPIGGGDPTYEKTRQKLVMFLNDLSLWQIKRSSGSGKSFHLQLWKKGKSRRFSGVEAKVPILVIDRVIVLGGVIPKCSLPSFPRH
jgi:hypothetical protein